MKRFVPSILLTVAIAVAAPYVGVLRQSLFEAFPMRALLALGAMLLVLGIVALLYAFLKIRSRRLPRFLGLLGAFALMWVQNLGFGAFDIEVNVIEKIHIVEYGTLAWWLYLAILRDRRARQPDEPEDPSILLLPLLGVVIAGTLDETVQWLVATRTGDVYDIALDLFSGASGLLFALSLEPPRRFRWKMRRCSWVFAGSAVALLAVGGFVCEAHLGYMIDDPEIGQFRSWHRRDELIEASRQRRMAWSIQPPGQNASPWRLEDRYLTEAGWHLGHRDRNFELGYYYWVQQANRILGVYFAPYLDLEGFRRPGNRRYSPSVLKRIDEQSVVLNPRFYRSPVLQKRIYLWPSKPLWLGVVGCVAALFLGLALRVGRSPERALTSQPPVPRAGEGEPEGTFRRPGPV